MIAWNPPLWGGFRSHKLPACGLRRRHPGNVAETASASARKLAACGYGRSVPGRLLVLALDGLLLLVGDVLPGQVAQDDGLVLDRQLERELVPLVLGHREVPLLLEVGHLGVVD